MPDTGTHNGPGSRQQRTPAILRDAAIGMSDGLAVPFAITAGLSAAVDSNRIIIIAGLLAAITGSIAMGIGGYLARLGDDDHHLPALMPADGDSGQHSVEGLSSGGALFPGLGLSADTEKAIAEEMARDREEWLEFSAKYDLQLDEAGPKQARLSAIQIGCAYFLGGLVPLAPYWLSASPREGLILSAAITVICLFVFGYLKAKAMSQRPLVGALRAMLTGSAAAAAAFFVARLFTG